MNQADEAQLELNQEYLDGLDRPRGNPPYIPLTRILHTTKDGKPIVSEVTKRFPLFNRRQRRKIQRAADKVKE